MKSPSVTIYIPCRNYARFLSVAIESVRRQIFDDWELYLIDEGSSDETREIISAYTSRYPERIRSIVNDEPLGLRRVANLVLSGTSADFIMRLDADDWLDESALLVMVSKLRQSPDAFLCYPNYYFVDECGNIITIAGLDQGSREIASGTVPPHGACALVRTRRLKAMGGYDESIDAQDGWELWFCLRGDSPAIRVPTPLFYYRQHASSLSRDRARLLAARSKIFERATKLRNGDYRPSVLVVVAVREQYVNPNHNPYYSPMGEGTSLLERAINISAGSKVATDIMVSSSSNKVLEYSKQMEDSGSAVKHLRKLRDTIDPPRGLPIQSILTDAVRGFRAGQSYTPDIVVFYGIHTETNNSGLIDDIVHNLISTRVDSVFSVVPERDLILSTHPDGVRIVNPGRVLGISIESENMYKFTGGLVATWTDALESARLFGTNIGYIELEV
jgi:glycosyltransferase involved in cell wall biosynthesis